MAVHNTLIGLPSISILEDSIKSHILFSSEYYDIFRQTTPVKEIIINGHHQKFEGLTYFFNGTLNFKAGIRRYTFSNNNQKEQLKFLITQQLNYAEFSIEQPIWLFGLTLGINIIGNSNYTFYNPNLSLALNLKSLPLEQLRCGYKLYSLPGFFDAIYYTTNLKVPYAIRGTTKDISLKFSLIQKIHFEVEYQKSLGIPTFKNSSYSYYDSSSYNSYRANIQYISNLFDINSNLMYGEFTNNIDLLYEGSSFGPGILPNSYLRFMTLNLNFHFIEKNIISIKSGIGSMSGKIVGTIQSWPFLSTLESLITNRLNYRIFGELYGWYAGLERNWRFNIVTFFTQVLFVDIKPVFKIQSWQPMYIVFGFKNFTENALDITHLGLLATSLAANFSLKICDMSISGGMLLPLFILKQQAKPQVAEITSPHHPILSGGRWVNISILKNI